VGQRRLGIGVDRNVSLDEESAAGSGGITGGPEPTSEREYTDLDRIAAKGESSLVQRFFEFLGYVPQTLSNARKGRVVGLEDALEDRGSQTRMRTA
jgi:hypothetical protein